MNWDSKISFGKYQGEPLLKAWIIDKSYFIWGIKEKVDKPEIHFIKNNLTFGEKKQFGIK